MGEQAETTRWARPPNGDSQSAESLYEHAQTVARHAATNTPANATLNDGTPLKPLLKTLAWTHDIGKATTWFQQKINNTVPDAPAPTGDASSHSPLGAPITWWICQQAEYSTYASALSALAVARHHGTIPDIQEYLITDLLGNDQRWELLAAQVENINEYAPDTATTLIAEALRETSEQPVEEDWSEIADAIVHGEIREEMWCAVQADYGSGLADLLTGESVYSDLLQLWSGLKGADTLAAANDSPFSRAGETSPDDITEYIEDLPSASSEIEQELNQARERAREHVLDAISHASGEPGLYSVTLPTGGGKTLTGTQAALALRDAADARGPLIYALPYTSIIDQTADTFTDVFESSYPSSVLNVHHHLAPETPDDEHPSQAALSRLARDSWHADITLTTFVQLWESLAGPTQGQATKLPSLYESTIILDEPQALPLTWWPAVEYLLETLVQEYSARVILMSATQPQFETPEPVTELAEDVAVDIPNRTTISLHPSLGAGEQPVSDEVAADAITDAVTQGAASVLSIQNTVASTRDVQSEVSSRLDRLQRQYVSIHDLYSSLLNEDAASIDAALPSSEELVDAVVGLDSDAVVTCPLTTRHRPCDRRTIIDALGDVLDDANNAPGETPTVVAVTTQLVEAGVDLSFEVLFRDYAPYDSLIQAAGRCNRNYEAGVNGGEMTVWRMDSPASTDNSRLPSAAVYGSVGGVAVNRLELTRSVLQHVADGVGDRSVTVPEAAVVAHHSDYQELLRQHRPAESAVSNALKACLGRELLPASLIDSKPSCSVVVSRSRAGDHLIREYRSHLFENQFREANRVLSQLRDLQVDLPPSSREEQSIGEVTHSLERGLEGLESGELESTDAYSPVRGLQHPTDTVESRFL